MKILRFYFVAKLNFTDFGCYDVNFSIDSRKLKLLEPDLLRTPTLFDASSFSITLIMIKSGSSECQYIPGCDIDEYQISTNTSAEFHHNWHPFFSSKDTFLWNYSASGFRNRPFSKIQDSTIHNVVRKLNIARHKMYASDVLPRENKPISGSQCTSIEEDFGTRSLKSVDFGYAMIYSRALHSPCLQLDGLR